VRERRVMCRIAVINQIELFKTTQSTRVLESEMRNPFSFATNHRDFLLITYVQLNDQRQPREPADRIGAFTKVNRVSGIDRRLLPNRTGSELQRLACLYYLKIDDLFELVPKKGLEPPCLQVMILQQISRRQNAL